MAKAPVFKTPRTSPPASGWEPGHRSPALGYGNLEGVGFGVGQSYDNVPDCDYDESSDQALINRKSKAGM